MSLSPFVSGRISWGDDKNSWHGKDIIFYSDDAFWNGDFPDLAVLESTAFNSGASVVDDDIVCGCPGECFLLQRFSPRRERQQSVANELTGDGRTGHLRGKGSLAGIAVNICPDSSGKPCSCDAIVGIEFLLRGVAYKRFSGFN